MLMVDKFQNTHLNSIKVSKFRNETDPQFYKHQTFYHAKSKKQPK